MRHSIHRTITAAALALAGGLATLSAAEDRPRAVELTPDAEGAMKWGDPVNGLRAAIVIRPSPAEPKRGEGPELFLAVQNVSGAPIRLSDATAGPKQRELYLKQGGKTQAVIAVEKPTRVEVVLRPREAALLPILPTEDRASDGRSAGAHIAEMTLKEVDQSMVAEFLIDRAAGAWTGKLRAGEIVGVAAAAAGSKVFAGPAPVTARPDQGTAGGASGASPR